MQVLEETTYIGGVDLTKEDVDEWMSVNGFQLPNLDNKEDLLKYVTDNEAWFPLFDDKSWTERFDKDATKRYFLEDQIAQYKQMNEANRVGLSRKDTMRFRLLRKLHGGLKKPSKNNKV